MRTKKLMKLLMAYPMPRNQARKIVAAARDFEISNDVAYGAICMKIYDALMDSVEVYGGEM